MFATKGSVPAARAFDSPRVGRSESLGAMPVSSRSSLNAQSRNSSPFSSQPPGSAHWPAPWLPLRRPTRMRKSETVPL